MSSTEKLEYLHVRLNLRSRELSERFPSYVVTESDTASDRDRAQRRAKARCETAAGLAAGEVGGHTSA
jgi:hypothetical protein